MMFQLQLLACGQRNLGSRIYSAGVIEKVCLIGGKTVVSACLSPQQPKAHRPDLVGVTNFLDGLLLPIFRGLSRLRGRLPRSIRLLVEA
jgi:hypothetical protein